MERKTKHRLLGIMVVIGLVIILLPLFQDTKDIPPTTTLAAAPPFPDQSEQVASKDESVAVESAPMPQPEIASNAPTVENSINQQPDDTISTTSVALTTKETPSSEVSNQATPSLTPASQEVAATKVAEDEATSEETAPQLVASNAEKPLTASDNTVSKSEATQVNSASDESAKKYHYRILDDKKTLDKDAIESLMTPHSVSSSVTSSAPAYSEEKGISNLKTPVWVIQMGSYKNKDNAMRIVNQLRAGGYKAFVQETKTALGNQTRVFVGPEAKLNLANVLVSRLQEEMHMQGIVVKYQPLSS